MSKRKSRECYSVIDEIADTEAFLELVQEGCKDIEDPQAADHQSDSYRFSDRHFMCNFGWG